MCRVPSLGWAAKVGGTIIPTKMFVTRTVSDPEGPQIVLVTQRRADNVSHVLVSAKIYVDTIQSLVDTALFHVNALTETTSERRTHLFLKLPCKVSVLKRYE